MIRRITVGFIVAILISFPVYAGKNSPVVKKLDEEISKSDQYRLEKEGRINYLHERLKSTGNKDERIALEWKLYNEYRVFQLDTAMHHAANLYQLADSKGSSADLARAMAALMDGFIHSGYFKEAADVNNRLQKEEIPEDIAPFYYDNAFRLYDNLSRQMLDSVGGIRVIYEERKRENLNKLISATGPMSYEHGNALIELDCMDGLVPSEEINRRKGLISTYKLTDNQKADQYAKIAETALKSGDREQALENFVLAALLDIRNNNRNSSAIKSLSNLLNEDGEHGRAVEFISFALNEARAYNSPLQIADLERDSILIEAGKSGSKTHFGLLLSGLICSGIFIGISVYLFLIIRKMRTNVDQAKRTLKDNRGIMSQRNVELIATQRKVERLVSQLKEANEIKDNYIRQSLYADTDFLNSLENKIKSLARLVKEKKFDELRINPYQFGIKEERARIYKAFDATFLKLFPNFIEELNKLMPPSEQIELESDGSLPMEVRIFALIRLGITDPAEIAKYLNLSVKTVYVYKTKIKTKSLIDNNGFEERLMEIN